MKIFSKQQSNINPVAYITFKKTNPGSKDQGHKPTAKSSTVGQKIIFTKIFQIYGIELGKSKLTNKFA